MIFDIFQDLNSKRFGLIFSLIQSALKSKEKNVKFCCFV